MRAVWTIVPITIVILALLWVAWKFYKHLAAIRQSDPHRYLSRKKRQELADRKAELEIDRLEQDERERVRKYIDPTHPDSDVWKDLK